MIIIMCKKNQAVLENAIVPLIWFVCGILPPGTSSGVGVKECLKDKQPTFVVPDKFTGIIKTDSLLNQSKSKQ